MSRYASVELNQTAASLPGEGEPLRSEDWQLVQRIVSSSGFKKSVLLSNFLLYVCDRKLRGHEDEITEYQIGVGALGRNAAYNPGDDNIVRNYARILRQRLDEYFTAEGASEPTRIHIPRGSYVPVFERSPVAVHSPDQPPHPVLQATRNLSQLRDSRMRWILPAIFFLAICVGAVMAYRKHHNSPAYLAHEFWSEVFDAQRETYVVTADSGLAMLQDLTGQEVDLHEYVTGSLPQKFPGFDISQQHQNGAFGIDRFSNFTSTADLDTAVSLARMPEFAKGHAIVRYARDIRMDDLKHSNLILLGGPHANPWLQLFDSVTDFRIVFPWNQPTRHLDDKYILNVHPRPGERSIYSNVWNAESHETYTILAFLPSIDRTGFTLLIEGQNMAGTEAAADFALDRNAMAPILGRARLPDGNIGPFQILLQTRTVGASAPEAHVIVERYGSQ